MKPKLFRDPVHDIIQFDKSDDVERTLLSIIDSDAFQRLRRIRQLGFAYLVYHGAEHSRFSHSVGVLHVARRICQTLDIQDGDRLEVLVAAALHDIGHGPFSHAIERVTGIDHETYSRRVVLEHEPIRTILDAVDSKLHERVAMYFEPPNQFPADRKILLDIVSSQLDADRLDYILRDGIATGVKIGVYDFERIQAMFLSHIEASGAKRLAVSYRAREAVEGYLIARFHMFKQVYLHKTVRAAEKMLEALFQRAGWLLREGHTFASTVPDAIAGLLSDEGLDATRFATVDDTDVWVAIKTWRDSSDPVLSRLADGLVTRTLYKTFELDPKDAVHIARIVDRARDFASKAGLDPDYAVLIDRAQDTPYRPYDPTKQHAAHIPIISADGTAKPIEQVSDIVHLLGRDAYKITRLCVPIEIRDEVRAALAGMQQTEGL